MAFTLTDTELLERRRSRRRWIIPVSLATVGLLLALIVAVLFLTSSAKTIEEATAIYERMDKKSTRAQVEKLLGSPLYHENLDGNKTYIWLYVRQTWNSAECFGVLLHTQNEEKDFALSSIDGIVTGWDAWKFRWFLLKARLGINVDE